MSPDRDDERWDHQAAVVLDWFLRDDPPELRSDPDYREHMSRTVLYRSALLSHQLHLFGEDIIEHLPPRLLRPVFIGWRNIFRWVMGPPRDYGSASGGAAETQP